MLPVVGHMVSVILSLDIICIHSCTRRRLGRRTKGVFVACGGGFGDEKKKLERKKLNTNTLNIFFSHLSIFFFSRHKSILRHCPEIKETASPQTNNIP